MFGISMMEQAKRNRVKIKRKACKKLVKGFKKNLRSAIKEGRTSTNINISETLIFGVPTELQIEIYEDAMEVLKNHYGNEVVFDIERHGCMNSHKRLRGIIQTVK